MTDTAETIATPDSHAIARVVLPEVVDESDQVGSLVTSYDFEDHVTDFHFAADICGYGGWQQSVTLYHDKETDPWTVNESSLIPTEGVLVSPRRTPWKDRPGPTDLTPIDSIGTDPDDECIEEGKVGGSSLQDVNDTAGTFRLIHCRVLTSLGRTQAAKRWCEGPQGPEVLSTKAAEGNLCFTCGFSVPPVGEFDYTLGAYVNKQSPDDGRVVSSDHGCGEHFEIELPEPSQLWVQSKSAFGDLHIGVVANRPRKQEPAAQDEAEGEADKTGEPAGDDIEAQETVDGNAANTEPVEEVAGDGTSQSQSVGDESVAQSVSDSVVDVNAADSGDDSKSDADDEAIEEDILNNIVADDDEDDEMDDEEDSAYPSDDVTSELETVIDLIGQPRQNKADEE